MKHPIFGDMRSDPAKEMERRERSAELRRLMEAQWQKPGVRKARNLCRWTMPMRLGGDHGYADDIAGE